MPNRNALQEQADDLVRRLSPKMREVSSLVAGGMPVSKAFAETGYYDAVEDEVLRSVVGAAEVATVGTVFAVASDRYKEWYLNTNHLGGALSKNIRSGEAAEALRDVLKKGLRINNNVNQLADAVGAKSDVRIARVMRDLITETRTGTPKSIQKAIDSAEKYVKSLSGGPARGSVQLKNAYNRLIAEAKKGEIAEKYISNATQRKLRYINERIARTEMARSYEMTRRRAYNDDDGIVAFEWVLSPEHPVVDECDYLADADLYGMGGGVYPLDSGVDAPAHPNCLCTTVPIRGDIAKGRYSEERAQEYLRGLPEKDRKRVIGANTPIKEGTKALEKKGIEPKAKHRTMIPSELLKERQK